MALRNAVVLVLFGLTTVAFAQAVAPAATGGNAPFGGTAPALRGGASLPRPPVDQTVQALGAALFAAVLHDDPALADAYFFPRDAFLQVKAMQNPGRYWDRLHARFAADVHALHAGTPDIEHAQFDRLELARRGGLVQPGEEGNRLAYWASRHSRLHFRSGELARSFEVRVLITWDNRWYLIHLSEFHNPPRG